MVITPAQYRNAQTHVVSDAILAKAVDKALSVHVNGGGPLPAEIDADWFIENMNKLHLVCADSRQPLISASTLVTRLNEICDGVWTVEFVNLSSGFCPFLRFTPA